MLYIYIFKNDTVVACIFRYKYTWHVNMWYVYNMIYSAGFRIICNYVYVCVWWRNKCTAVLVQKGTPSAKWIVAKSLSMYLSLSHWNVLLPYKLYKSVAGKNRPTLDPICRSFLCLACLVWYLKSPSSDLALREQKKSEESEQTAQSEKRPNAITLSLVWAISSKVFLSRSKFKRGKFYEELH